MFQRLTESDNFLVNNSGHMLYEDNPEETTKYLIQALDEIDNAEDIDNKS